MNGARILLVPAICVALACGGDESAPVAAAADGAVTVPALPVTATAQLLVIERDGLPTD